MVSFVGFWTLFLESWARAWLCIPSEEEEEAETLATVLCKGGQSRDGELPWWQKVSFHL